MKGRVLARLFLCSLFFVVGGDAQSPNTSEKPVWTLELIKVRPENVALAMQYLNDHWMRVRAAAKRRGAVLGLADMRLSWDDGRCKVSMASRVCPTVFAVTY